MKIYIDVTRLITWGGNYTGMERLAFELTKELLAQKDASIETKLIIYTPEKGFKELGSNFNLGDDRLTSPYIGPSPSLRQLIKSNKKAFAYHYIRRYRQDRNLKTLNSLLIERGDVLLVYDGLWDQQQYIDEVIKLSQKGLCIAHIVCDVGPLIVPQACFDYVTKSFGNYFNQIAPNIDLLLSISKNTEKDFNSIYCKKTKKSLLKSVIRLGDNFSHATPEKPQQLDKNNEFILAVGTLEIRKNYNLLYQTYRLANDRRINLPDLIIVGKEGWLAEPTIHSIKNDPVVKDKIILAGAVNDSELSWLYKNCLFTVQPALYEGWGLPVSESLYYKKVCACSNSSSLPEIGEDLNLYYSPYDPAECLKTMETLLDKQTRSKMEKAIANKYKITTWQTTANTIKASIQTLVTELYK